MKKLKKWIPWIVMVFCLINCFLADYLILVNGAEFQIDVLNIIELIVMAFNFMFVIWVYFEDEKKDRNRDYTEKKKYWYHDILIEKNMPLLQELSRTSVSIADEGKGERDPLQQKIELRKVKDQKKELENSIGYLLKAYDLKLYQRFTEYLLDFEDVVTKRYTEMMNGEITKEIYVSDIKNMEVKIVKLLMNHDFQWVPK